MERIKNFWRSQWVDYINVTPMIKLVGDTFYLVSSAGILKKRCKEEKDIIAFRNSYANDFQNVCDMSMFPKAMHKEFIKLYAKIVKNEKKLTYKANLRTRINAIPNRISTKFFKL